MSTFNLQPSYIIDKNISATTTLKISIAALLGLAVNCAGDSAYLY